MYRFLLRPKFLAWNLFVLVVVVTFVNLGLWQLRRLQERKAYNADVAAAEAEPVAPVAELVPAGPDATPDQVEAVRYRSATVTGTYRVEEQVLVANRSNEGAPGSWVLTPLVRADGTAVVVNRGWVPFDYRPDGSWTDFDPPSGPVEVTGMLQRPQVRGGGWFAGPEDPQEGVLRSLARVDVARLQEQVDEPLVPLYLDLAAQTPAQAADLPVPVPPPVLDEGPHLGYAGQWFLFAGLAVLVDVVMMRKAARRRQRADGGPDDGPAPGPADPGRVGAPDGPADPDGEPDRAGGGPVAAAPRGP